MQGQRVYLVEYGAGFFVETSANNAIQFYQRKISMIKEKSTKLQELINQKREGIKACEMKMYAMVQEQQQQAQKA